MYTPIVLEQSKMDGGWVIFFFPVLVGFDVTNFQKTMFCSLSSLSLVLISNAWFNRFRVYL